MSTTILGVSAGFHDSAIAIVDHGDILFASHSERYSGVKHDRELSHDLVKDATNLTHKIVDRVAYYERPWVKYAAQVRAGTRTKPAWADTGIRKILPANFKKTPIDYFNHHQSHAASAFQTSEFDKATCIVVDAIGEFDTISIWNAWYDKDGFAKYEKVWGRSYPDSIGLLYSAVTQRVGLDPMNEEYILMGMAAYGDTKYEQELKDALIGDNISLKENVHAGLPRKLLPAADDFDMAASIQSITEQLLMEIFLTAQKVGHSKNFCYSGGVALNCVANSMLVGLCDNLWIMPNPGDAGAALGAAALGYGKRLHWEGPYLGYDINPYTGYPVYRIIKELQENKIVGVAHGRAEYGPRALGNRSLFADPRGPNIKSQVNKIKRRQKFRPFAPVILEEQVHKYFDMPNNIASSPYMQFTGTCKFPEEFPAIIHADGTSRVQTVNKHDHKGLYRLLTEWEKETGCPMLLNTSLNIRGKPMVNNIEDAMAFQNEYDVTVIT